MISIRGLTPTFSSPGALTPKAPPQAFALTRTTASTPDAGFVAAQVSPAKPVYAVKQAQQSLVPAQTNPKPLRAAEKTLPNVARSPFSGELPSPTSDAPIGDASGVRAASTDVATVRTISLTPEAQYPAQHQPVQSGVVTPWYSDGRVWFGLAALVVVGGAVVALRK